MTTPRVVSVNVGGPRTVTWGGRVVTSGIWKAPVASRVVVEGVNLHGDDQADRRVHGGRDKAVYAYAAEDYAWWSNELGEELGPGTFGDNLTTEGIDLQACVIGQPWQVGSTVLEVAQPRTPCFKLGIRMNDATFVERFEASRRSGAYLRIVEEGAIGAGDSILTGAPPEHGLTISELVDAQHGASRDTLERIVSIDDLPDSWTDWALRQLERHHSSGSDTVIQSRQPTPPKAQDPT